MLFHVGTLRRLNDSGLLPKIKIISSVSGGSITAAFLASRWNELRFNKDGKVDSEMFELVIEKPLRRLADETLDIPSVSVGLLPLASVGQQQARQFDKMLFGNVTLESIAAEDTKYANGPFSWPRAAPRPVFIINATSLQTGERWQFHGRAMGGLQTLWTDPGKTLLSEAVAASSGFPPMLSPVKIEVKNSRDSPALWHDCNSFERNPYGIDQRAEPGKVIPEDELPLYRESIYLVDGGVRDNLGLAPIFDINRLRALRQSPKGLLFTLISDGGQTYDLDPTPSASSPVQLLRIVGIATSEPDEIRVESLIRSGQDTIGAMMGQQQQQNPTDNPLECHSDASALEYQLNHRILVSQRYKPHFAYWSIRRMPKHHIGFNCPQKGQWITPDDVRELSQIPTRFKKLSPKKQERLINWGYLAAHHGLPYIPLFWNPPEQRKAILSKCSLPYEKIGIGRASAVGITGWMSISAHSRLPITITGRKSAAISSISRYGSIRPNSQLTLPHKTAAFKSRISGMILTLMKES